MDVNRLWITSESATSLCGTAAMTASLEVSVNSAEPNPIRIWHMVT